MTTDSYKKELSEMTLEELSSEVWSLYDCSQHCFSCRDIAMLQLAVQEADKRGYRMSRGGKKKLVKGSMCD
jgi:hypothetical protein